MTRDTHTGHLAGEFLVAGELSRRRYPVSITMGRAKSVDIYADSRDGTFRVNVKAIRNKSDWPTREDADPNVYYIFVYLGSAEQTPKKKPSKPEYFVVRGEEIKDRGLVTTFGRMQGIKYAKLNSDDYSERWDKLPPPPMAR